MLALVLALALDVERTMDAATVQRALKDTEAATSSAYLIRAETPMVVISTPYARVAAIGKAAGEEYRPVPPAQLEEAAALTFEVYASPYKGAEVRRIVMSGKDGTIVQPTKETPERTRHGQAVLAIFPLHVLVDGAEVRVVTAAGEERVPITQAFLDKIR